MNTLKSFEQFLNEGKNTATLTADLHGEGNKLFAVIEVDTDDSEDSRVGFWKAKDEDDVYDQFLQDLKDREEFDDNEEAMERNWQINWIPQELGTINANNVSFSRSINGESGNVLYSLLVVDKDDAEDSRVEIWRAKDDDDLYEKVKKEFVGSYDEDEDYNEEEFGEVDSAFDEDWNFYILPTEIGRV